MLRGRKRFRVWQCGTQVRKARLICVSGVHCGINDKEQQRRYKLYSNSGSVALISGCTGGGDDQ
eukprot:1287648-Rhodomonas_salina.1